MTVRTIITSCLYKKSKHFSILTDVIYKKELSLCINLLFLVLPFGVFSLNISIVGVICFGLNCCYVCFPFFHMVLEVEELVPQHGARPQCCLHSSTAPSGMAAVHVRMGKGLLFFQVSHWFGGKLCSHRSCLPATRVWEASVIDTKPKENMPVALQGHMGLL